MNNKKINMKTFAKLTFAITIAVFFQICHADQIYLYDGTGNVAAVLDRGNETTDRPILYLASGDPVGYVDSTNANNALYTFSGNQVGWFYDNIIWDNYGNIVAFADTNKPDVVTVPLIQRRVFLHQAIIPEIDPTTFVEVVSAPPPYNYQMSKTSIIDLVKP